jgi:hypothetical protein
MGFSVKQSPLDLSGQSSPGLKRISILTSRPESVINNINHPRLSLLQNLPHTLSMRSPRLPNCRPESSASPKPYIAFTTPRLKSSKALALEAETDAKLEKFHQDMNRSRLEEAKLKKIMICKD